MTLFGLFIFWCALVFGIVLFSKLRTLLKFKLPRNLYELSIFSICLIFMGISILEHESAFEEFFYGVLNSVIASFIFVVTCRVVSKYTKP